MPTTEPLIPMRDAAAELGWPYGTLYRRARKWGLMPTRRLPGSPKGLGYTPEEMEKLKSLAEQHAFHERAIEQLSAIA